MFVQTEANRCVNILLIQVIVTPKICCPPAGKTYVGNNVNRHAHKTGSHPTASNILSSNINIFIPADTMFVALYVPQDFQSPLLHLYPTRIFLVALL